MKSQIKIFKGNTSIVERTIANYPNALHAMASIPNTGPSGLYKYQLWVSMDGISWKIEQTKYSNTLTIL